MEVHVDDKGRRGYVISDAKAALECLTVVESYIELKEWDNGHLVAAVNGLDRWLQKQIAREER